MLTEILSMIKDKLDTKSFLGNVPHAPAVNQGRSLTLIDTDSMIYAPQAYTQASVENYGNQNSAVINQDISIVGNFSGAQFIQTTDNNLSDNGGIVVLNKTVNDKTANALLYNGYSVMDGDI